MTTTMTPRLRTDDRGFSLVELLAAVAITLVVMGSTMMALGDAWKAADSATLITNLNSGLRVAMDLVVRDLLQVGQGLPTGRLITVPSGATAIRLPGPPGTTYTVPNTTTQLTAVIPGPGRGPSVNNQATDMITTLAADSAFETRCLTALTDTSMTVALPAGQTASCGANTTNPGPGAINPGDLIMLWKGALSTLVQVTSVAGQVVNFNGGDSMNLNQPNADGGVNQYRLGDGGEPLVSGRIASNATRIRMITYYLDTTTTPGRPRLVRRMNNGHPTTFDNTLGTAVAFDVENLSISYDLADSAANATSVRMTDTDIAGGVGAAAGCPCDPERIRKVNVLLAARASRPMRVTRQVFRNSLMTQVSLRSLAFVDEYR
jgi:prepilin-type N-terminal cleavage/methylation domain-containing protein